MLSIGMLSRVIAKTIGDVLFLIHSVVALNPVTLASSICVGTVSTSENRCTLSVDQNSNITKTKQKKSISTPSHKKKRIFNKKTTTKNDRPLSFPGLPVDYTRRCVLFDGHTTPSAIDVSQRLDDACETHYLLNYDNVTVSESSNGC